MKRLGKIIYLRLNLIGFNSLKFLRFFQGIPFYLRDYWILKEQLKVKKEFTFGKTFPILDERKVAGGTMKGHYFHQDLFVAHRIFNNNPTRHIDIGSRLFLYSLG